jgi:hypothetical protein
MERKARLKGDEWARIWTYEAARVQRESECLIPRSLPNVIHVCSRARGSQPWSALVHTVHMNIPPCACIAHACSAMQWRGTEMLSTRVQQSKRRRRTFRCWSSSRITRAAARLSSTGGKRSCHGHHMRDTWASHVSCGAMRWRASGVDTLQVAWCTHHSMQQCHVDTVSPVGQKVTVLQHAHLIMTAARSPDHDSFCSGCSSMHATAVQQGGLQSTRRVATCTGRHRCHEGCAALETARASKEARSNGQSHAVQSDAGISSQRQTRAAAAGGCLKESQLQITHAW